MRKTFKLDSSEKLPDYNLDPPDDDDFYDEDGDEIECDLLEPEMPYIHS